MYVKILRGPGFGGANEPAPSMLFECDHLEWRWLGEDEDVEVRDDAIYAFCQPPLRATPEPAAFRAEMWLWRDVGDATQVLLSNAIVYVMNDEGKTVDKFYV